MRRGGSWVRQQLLNDERRDGRADSRLQTAVYRQLASYGRQKDVDLASNKNERLYKVLVQEGICQQYSILTSGSDDQGAAYPLTMEVDSRDRSGKKSILHICTYVSNAYGYLIVRRSNFYFGLISVSNCICTQCANQLRQVDLCKCNTMRQFEIHVRMEMMKQALLGSIGSIDDNVAYKLLTRKSPTWQLPSQPSTTGS